MYYVYRCYFFSQFIIIFCIVITEMCNCPKIVYQWYIFNGNVLQNKKATLFLVLLFLKERFFWGTVSSLTITI